MTKTMNCQKAYEVAVKQLKNEPAAAAVTVEFVMQTTGLTKWMRVWRDDRIDIANPGEMPE